MIASTRLIKAQRGMEVAKRYGQASSCNFFFLSLFFSANPSGHLTLNVIYGGESFVKIFHWSHISVDFELGWTFHFSFFIYFRFFSFFFPSFLQVRRDPGSPGCQEHPHGLCDFWQGAIPPAFNVLNHRSLCLINIFIFSFSFSFISWSSGSLRWCAQLYFPCHQGRGVQEPHHLPHHPWR